MRQYYQHHTIATEGKSGLVRVCQGLLALKRNFRRLHEKFNSKINYNLIQRFNFGLMLKFLLQGSGFALSCKIPTRTFWVRVSPPSQKAMRQYYQHHTIATEGKSGFEIRNKFHEYVV